MGNTNRPVVRAVASHQCVLACKTDRLFFGYYFLAIFGRRAKRATRARMASRKNNLPVLQANVSWVWFLDPLSHVGWVCCWFLSLLRGFFLWVLQFSPTKRNTSKFQFDQNPRGTGLLVARQLCATLEKKKKKCATLDKRKSIFKIYFITFVKIALKIKVYLFFFR